MGEGLIGNARPSDASGIGELLRLAFDARYLLMSVYSSPLGDRHLERSLQSGRSESHKLRVRVVRSGDQVLGCTIVSIRERECHLDYVATAPSIAGSGLGARLLGDALDSAQGRLSLDVFASNHTVREWYLRRGFAERYARVVQVADLGRVPAASEWGGRAREALRLAQDSEMVQGFGEFTIEAGSDAYRFGLLGESKVRLLECPEGEASSAASIVRALLPDREFFALPIGQKYDELPTFFTDRLIRMEPPL